MEGALLLAPRRSEHVACAGGASVLAAGEIRFARSAGAGDGGAAFKVAYASNHSTGYCPEPACFEALAAALDRLGVAHAGRFHCAHHFRRCAACGQINLVKDDWWNCAVCGEGLPRTWNLEADHP